MSVNMPLSFFKPEMVKWKGRQVFGTNTIIRSKNQNQTQIFGETRTKKEPFCKRQNMVETSGETVSEAECKNMVQYQ